MDTKQPDVGYASQGYGREKADFLLLRDRYEEEPMASLNYQFKMFERGEHKVTRVGDIFGKTEDVYPYDSRGLISIIPHTSCVDTGLQNRLYIKYSPDGAPCGAGIRAGEKLMHLAMLTREMEELMVEHFPFMRLKGELTICTLPEKPLPMDINRADFADISKSLLIKNAEFQRFSKAHKSFLELAGFLPKENVQ